MGLKRISKINNKNGDVRITYKCTHCYRTIFTTPPIKKGESFEFDRITIPNHCVCGEKLIGEIKTVGLLIDEIETIIYDW